MNGVSLTVNRVVKSSAPTNEPSIEFSINLIPHTMANTTLRHLQAGNRVNLEIDLIARYVEQILSTGTAA